MSGMKRYLATATISVEAGSATEARNLAKFLCEAAERMGMGYCVLDESQPIKPDPADAERQR